MAPDAMTTSMIEPNAEQLQHRRMTTPELEAQRFEGDGKLINEWCSKSEYISRRQGFLGRHRSYRLTKRLLPKVYREADRVFVCEDAILSVQKIRRHELACEVEPLLPFPTTSNTDSVDNFETYGEYEWNPSVTRTPAITRAKFTPPSIPSIYSTPPHQVPQIALQLDDASAQNLPSSRTCFVAPQLDRALMHPAKPREADPASGVRGSFRKATRNAADGAAVSEQTQLGQDCAASSPAPPSPRNTAAPPSNVSIANAAPSAPPPRLMQRVLESLGSTALANPPLATPTATNLAQTNLLPQYDPEQGISSVTSRGISLPVKERTCRIKRSAPDPGEGSDVSSALDSIEGVLVPSVDASSMPPPKKVPRLKLNGPREERVTTITTVSSRFTSEGVSLNKVVTAQTPPPSPSVKLPATRIRTASVQPPAKSEATNVSPTKTSTSAKSSVEPAAPRFSDGRTRSKPDDDRAAKVALTPAPTPETQLAPGPAPALATALSAAERLARIANGTLIPRSRKEAKEAQALRKKNLPSQTRKNNKRSTANRYIDLSLEFFDMEKFTDLEKEDGPVRCICGVTTDEKAQGEEWVRCDGGEESCYGVWMHVKCVGNAVASDTAEREQQDFWCHACDPYKHRHALAKVRKGESVN